jgi:hypothetical protein
MKSLDPPLRKVAYTFKTQQKSNKKKTKMLLKQGRRERKGLQKHTTKKANTKRADKKAALFC